MDTRQDQPLLLNEGANGVPAHHYQSSSSGANNSGVYTVPETEEVGMSHMNGTSNGFVALGSDALRAVNNYHEASLRPTNLQRRHSSATVLDLDERIRAENLIRDFIRSQDIEEQGRSQYVRHDRLSTNDAYLQPVPMQRRRAGSHVSQEVQSALDELLSVVSTEMDYAPSARKPEPERPWKENSKLVLKEMIGNFMGDSPNWYKYLILFFLVLNPIIFFSGAEVVAGWFVVVEFIITLAMALKCYPLEPGGLLAIEVVAIGMTSPQSVFDEIEHNLEVILLLMFMVAATHFLKHMLLYTFTKILLYFESKIPLCFAFQMASALLSAFLDALTVTAVLIAVIMGLQKIYTRYQRRQQRIAEEAGYVKQTPEQYAEAEEFKFFLRDLMMHAIVGTALGGGLTAVGEPQNLIIADDMDWGFGEYFFRLAPVTVPVLVAGCITLVIVEYFKWFSYGHVLEPNVRQIIADHKEDELAKQTPNDTARLIVQALVSVFIVFALAFQLAAVGIVGLAAIILVTAGNGIIDEEKLGKSFQDALPFTALLSVFFAIVAMIDSLELFQPIIEVVLEVEDIETKLLLFYIVTGVLSMISDNVFVATIYINQLISQFQNCAVGREEFDLLAVAINSGTNVLSVATPNGQAAFLFLLTSALAPKLDLTYVRMVIMAFPYTIIMSIAGFFGNYYILQALTPAMEGSVFDAHPEWPECVNATLAIP